MSYYGYERLRPGEALGIDMAKVTDIFDKDIKEYEKTKGENRESIAKSNRDLAKLLSTMPSSFASEYNAFWANISNETMTKMSAVNKLFADGKITKQHHSTLVANFNSQTGLLVDGMSAYVTQENEMSKQCMPGGTMGNEDCFKWKLASLYSDLANVTVSYDENSYQPTLIRQNPDGSPDSMGVTEYFNITQGEPAGHYDLAGQIDEQLKLIGIKEKRDKYGNLIKGEFLTQEGKEATAAIDNAAQAMIAQPWNMRGLLSSQPFTLYENGVETDYVFTHEALPARIYDDGGIIKEDELKALQDKNPHVFYFDKSGKWHESDEAKRVAYEYAKFRLTTAAEITKQDALTTPTDPGKAYDRFRLGLELVNRAGKKIPDYLLKLALTSIPGMNEATAAKLFGDLTFEDKDTRSSSQQEKDRKAARDNKILASANEWYDNVFLKDVVDDEKKYTTQEIDEMLINTPFTIDQETGEVMLGDDVLYKFDTTGWFSSKVKGKDIKRFKTKLKSLLGNDQEVLLYFTENPDMMSKDWGGGSAGDGTTDTSIYNPK